MAPSGVLETRELARICTSWLLLAELYWTTASLPAPVGEIAALKSQVDASFTSPCWRRAEAPQAPALQFAGSSSYQRITDRPVAAGSAITCCAHTPFCPTSGSVRATALLRRWSIVSSES